jgi:RHS repeat-associated protein
LQIPLSGANVPASLIRIDVEIKAGGRLFTASYPPSPNQSTLFEWDGVDAYGRVLQGAQTPTVRIGYAYRGVYQRVERFGYFGNGIEITGSVTRQEVTLWQENGGISTLWDARSQGLGGWTLNVQHAYDPFGHILYLGDGSRRDATTGVNKNIITTVAGIGAFLFGGGGYSGDGGPATQAMLAGPTGVAVGQDGAVYIADYVDCRIRRVDTGGIITTIAGNGSCGDSGDNGPATQAGLSPPYGVAVGPDGSIYIAENTTHRIRRVAPDGIITTIAGTGSEGFLGDNGPATQALIGFPLGVAVGPDGSVYIAAYGRIRKVGPDGIISTVAGGGPTGNFVDGVPATQVDIDVQGLTMGADGVVYLVGGQAGYVKKVSPDGIITTIAGNGVASFGGDGGLARQASLYLPTGVAVGRDRTVFVADMGDSRIRRISPEGVITTFAGNYSVGYWRDGVPATQTDLAYPRGVAAGPDGSIYIADTMNSRIRKVSTPPTLMMSLDEAAVPSDDGSELFVFGPSGRHKRTLNALTGSVLFQFAYDNTGHLSAITDGDGNVTTIERDTSGTPTAIVAPFGQRTALGLTPTGYLESISDPAGETHRFTYSDGGLLLQVSDPKGNATNFVYDALGRLIRDTDAAGGYQDLARIDSGNGYEVIRTTAMGRSTTYRVEYLPDGGRRRVNTSPGGGATVDIRNMDGTRIYTSDDNTTTNATYGPDPRFGMEAPVVTSISTRAPSGLERAITRQRSVTLATPSDLFSIQTQTDNVTVNGRRYLTTYDNATRTFTLRTPSGRERSATIDNQGRILSSRLDSSLVPQDVAYNSSGLPAQVSRGDQILSFDYDSLGRPVMKTDAGGNTVAFGYDGSDRVSRLTLPSGRAYGFSYDQNGNLAQVVMPGGQIHGLRSTAINLDNSYTPPGSAPYLWSYDLDRAWARTTYPGGRTLDASYDAGGRPTGWAYPEAQVEIAYAPGDNTSRVHRVVRTPVGGGPVQEISLEYDGRLVTGMTFTGASNGQFRYVYDNNFFLMGVSLSSGPDNVSIGLARDADGLTTRYGPFSWTREGPAGRVSRITDGVLDVSITYDGLGRTSSRTHTVNGVSVYRLQVTYDNVGRIVRRDETTAGVSRMDEYSYDFDAQLTGVKRDGSTFETYGYDTNGNRTLRQDGSAPPVAATYDNQDRLTQQGSIEYRHDADGYLVQRGGDTFRYSARGELLEATVEGVNVAYAYDGWGRRVARSDGSGTTQYLYGSLSTPFQLTASRDPSGVLTLYYYAQNRLFAFDRGMSRYYVGADYVGTPRIVTDSTGTAVRVLDTDSFGNVLNDSDPSFLLPVGFAGGLYDPITNMVRFGYRDYDSSTGRWNTKDPILFLGGNTNLYVYTFNDPVNFIDPSGKVNENPSPGSERADFGNGNYDEAIATAPSNHPGVSNNIGSGPVHIGRQCQSGKCSETVWDPVNKFSAGCAADVESTNKSDSDLNNMAGTIVKTDKYGTYDVTVSFGWPTIWYINPHSVNYTNELGL